ncbi:FG-GAP-like repeat-containing protein, partial [Hymenobacter agri]
MMKLSSLSGRLAALGLLLATAGAAQAQTFAPAVTYATGNIPQDIVAADVNGDGRLDLINANSNSNSVGVLLGSATTPGTFPATATFYGSGGNFPVGLGVGDVNGDGRPDIVVDNANSNNVSVLLGSATTPGTFLAAVSYGSGATAPRGLGLIDLNGDGRLDIVVGGSDANIGVLLNQAATPGTFGPAVTYTSGVATDGIAVGDVNGDGRADVAVTGFQTTNTITVLLNSAATPGTFPTATAYNSGGVKPRGVTLADVNGDGRADIIAGNETSNTVGVLFNQAATPGTFGTAAMYASGASGPDGVRVRDMNGDGRPDIVATNYNVSSGTTVSVLLNSVATPGTFATGTTYSSGGQGPVGLALGDLNNDGRSDIAATNVLSSTVGVLLNTTLFNTPTLTSLSPTSGPAGTSVILTGTNFTGATAVSFNGTAATAFTVNSATQITATVPTGATTGLVTVTTPVSTSNGVTFTVTYPDLVISTPGQSIAAGTYNSITVTGTGTGTLAGNVVVNSSTIINSGGTLNDGCFVLSGGGDFTLAPGGTLGICNAQGLSSTAGQGTLQNTGFRSLSTDATYVYNGTAAQVTGGQLPFQVRSLTSTNSNTVTLSQAVSVAQVLTLNAGSLNLNGRTLTLLSNASGTALVANPGFGSVIGNTVAVQRYIDPSLNPGLGYRHLVAPVAGATVAAFGSGGTTPVVNDAYNAAADPGSVNPFPTIYRYDQSRLATSPATTLSAFDRGWVSPTDLSNAAQLATTGFTVQLPGASTLSFTGQVGNGNGSISLSSNSDATAANAGLNLIGNPYPAPLDLSTITAGQRANMDAAFYVFESTSQYGGSYRTYINGVGTNSLVGTAQAFFVRVTAGQTSGSLGLSNANRVTTFGQQAPVRRTAETRPLVQLDLKGTTGLADAFIAYAQGGATAGFDGEYDAPKLANSSGLNLSSTAASGERLAIEGRPEFLAATVLPLSVGVPAAGTYTITATQLLNLPAGLDAYLRDAQTGQTVNLRTQPSYSFTATAAQASGLLVEDDLRTVLQLPLVAGRWFDKSDDAAATPPAVITTDLAARLFPQQSALGQVVKRNGSEYRVVGLTGPMRADDPLSEGRPAILRRVSP